MSEQSRSAVVDLGSNSVRLVVFEGRGRNPTAIFNEKAVLRLGRGLQQTGRLNEEGVAQAVTVMGRYAAIARAMGAEPFEALATAAVRDASNGAEFIATLEREVPGLVVRILSGQQEAGFSAAGLVCGIPEARGILADIGGGSLEVVQLAGGELLHAQTLKLGVIRLADRSGGDVVRAPLNLSLAVPQLLLQLLGRVLGRRWPRAGALLKRPILLRTAVGRQLEWLIVTELLELPLVQGRRRSDTDALAGCILAARL